MNQHFKSSKCWWRNAFEAHKLHDICLETNAKVWTQKYKIAFSCRNKDQTILEAFQEMDWTSLHLHADGLTVFTSSAILIICYFFITICIMLLISSLLSFEIITFRVVVHSYDLMILSCKISESDKQFKVYCLY